MKLSMIQVSFDDTAFRTSHLRNPKGYGGWMFEITWYTNTGVEEVDPTPIRITNTFTEAKKLARKEAQRLAEVVSKTHEVTIASCVLSVMP